MSDLIDIRKEYIDRIKRELLGPGSEISIPSKQKELISTSPDVRYSIGILFPRETKMNADNDDTNRVEESVDIEDLDDSEEIENQPESAEGEHDPVLPGEEENLDEEIGMAAQNLPSSLGLTFFARGDTDLIRLSVEFGTYRHATAKDCKLPYTIPAGKDPDSLIPAPLSNYITYDEAIGCVVLTRGGLTRRIVSQFREKDIPGIDDNSLFDSMYKLASQLKNGFVRVPHTAEVLLDFRGSDYIDNNKNLDGTSAKITALRRKLRDNLYSVTVMLVNDCTERATGTNCLFQPLIVIDTTDNGFVFQDYSKIVDFHTLDDEEKSLELQYRNKKVYGTGLGTAVNWEIDEFGKGILVNDFFPEVEVPSMDFGLPPAYGVSANTLSMKYLSDLNKDAREKKAEFLSSLVSAYREWISKIEKAAGKLPEQYKEIAGKNIAGCMSAYKRMAAGLETLCSDTLAWDAFQLANRAMFMQRAHLKLQEKLSDKDRFPNDEELQEVLSSLDYHTVDSVINDRYSWRPFQLAFLLMSINSICKDDSEDRELVDLIWFPTGGGKTEAYLGLTAFTIFYRRLAHPGESSGTSVIMRYTLRLLAAQQFTRASTLICACEYIRRDSVSKRPKYGKYNLGSTPVTIGLWIGHDHTPNTNLKAKEELKHLTDANIYNLREEKDYHNKFQVLKCPWCGTKLVKERVENRLVGKFGYRMKNNSHFELYCPQENCFFNDIGALPVQVVDEELYLNPPTLLFGTVDKFAMLPWKKEIASFFAIGTGNRAPELIIQDELHLISGPLGTMVGLYESAIDYLCASKGVKTKIVASTATIRRAKEQCSALYDRDVAQFPPPGIDAEDSFFARESVIDHAKGVFGRKYIGLMPSGKTKAMMEVRSIAALMQSINTMSIADDDKDKFWTLTVYFNSLKDLGKCATLVDDDVKDFIKRTAFRTGTARDARRIARADELTSRVSTTELNETLDKLEKVTYSKLNESQKRYASNILLATNMISVGIDVARLNVMLLVGQPKLTSEYIQASSRIGRSFPGVAFAMYDGSKSRDRSHYEQFKAYHESFYKHVEPTGVTPFSKPARDRALHAVVVSLLRYLDSDLMPEKGAALFSRKRYEAAIAKIKNSLAERNTSIISRTGMHMADDRQEICDEIDVFLDKWETLAELYDDEHFFYGSKFMRNHPGEDEGRLLKAFNTDPSDAAVDTMTSMRNVDSTVAGNVLVWEG